MPDVKKPTVKILRPQEGEKPKVRVSEKRAIENRRKAMSSTMNNYFDYSKKNAEYDPLPKGRFTDSRGAACAAASRTTTMDKVLNPTKEAYSEPQPQPRVPDQHSRANLERGRGRINIFGGAARAQEPPSPLECPPPQRCQTASAVDNLRRSQSGVMASVIVHSRDFTEPQRPLRGDNKAASNAERARGSSMAATLDHRKSYIEDPPKPRCPSPKAMEQRERARGTMGKAMSGQLNGDPYPKQRLGLGAEKNARREGGEMATNLSRYGKLETDPQPHARVKPEAQRYATKNSGSLTQLQYNYKMGPGPNDEPEPKTRTRPGPAQSIKNASQGVVTKNLMCMYGQLPGDIKPKSRVQPRGRKIARLSSGSEMRNILAPPKPKRVRRRPKSCNM